MLRANDLKFRLFIILVLIVLSCLYIYPPQDKLKLGLDLKGGMYILLRADTSNLPPQSVGDAVETAREIIRNRIDALGVKEPYIEVQGKDNLLIQLPGEVDRDRALRIIGQTALLEFKLVEEDEEKLKQALEGNIPEGYELVEFEDKPILLHKEASLTGASLKNAQSGFDNRMFPNVILELNSEGANKFSQITKENVGKRLAILLDGKVKSAPYIREPITGGNAEISGKFTVAEARDLALVLKAGALPCPLKIEEERTIGPLLGSDSIRRGINSIILGALLVVLFMIFYYRLCGVVANLCLLLDLLFILGGLSLINASLTLPGIAGIALTFGMAVDSNVLIFERIREELNLGKPLSLAIRNGFDKAKVTIFDANITTLIAAFFLFLYGTGPIRGFATTLSLGIVVSIFTAVFVSRAIFAFLLSRNLKKISMMKFMSSSQINFIRIGKFCLLVSFVLIIVGMGRFISLKERAYSVDFTGGQVLEYKIAPFKSIETLRNLFTQKGLSGISLQEFRDIEGGIIIKSKEDITHQVESILKENFSNVERLNVTTVGPSVGKLLKKKAIFAIIFSLAGILIYVALRFKHFDFALAGVIALFHDVLVSLGFAVFFGYQVSLLIITALLTIAGYSINDTIVIYDRIRELVPRMQKVSFKDIINSAINQTLSRTVITSFTTIIVTLAIFILGGEVLRGFSFTLLVGFISGIYSTIYIASAIILLFRKSFQ
ncbi:MAG: protein translocase subunit SecD [Candidatus Omnitrophica bacterium]|nr:protein translocase subunit SecD [Candidatus Omnitrophota bacterium]